MGRGEKQFEKALEIRFPLGILELKSQDPLPYGRGDEGMLGKQGHY